MADVRRELGTIERIRWPILGAISNGDSMGIYYMEAWVLSRESAGLDGWTPLFATK